MRSFSIGNSIIWHNGATEQAAVPLDQISPNTDVTQQTEKKKKEQISKFYADFFLYYSTLLLKIGSKELIKSGNQMPYSSNSHLQKRNI